jgi:hypothetical protein
MDVMRSTTSHGGRSPLLSSILLACLTSAACNGPAPTTGASTSASQPSISDGSNSNFSDNTVAAVDTVISLAWQPNSDNIGGYIVYYGPTPALATTAATNLSVTSRTFDAQAPVASFNAGRDLQLKRGDNVCFRLRAYNGAVMSSWSDAVCSVI